MSRRGAVLEGYRVPDLTNPINPIDAQRMVSQERMHSQELEQNKQRQKVKAQEDRDKGLTIDPSTSGTIYDPTGLKATQDLNAEIMAYAKANPDKSIAEVKMTFAPKANKIAQYYEKAKTIKGNADTWTKEVGKNGGYNTGVIGLKAQQLALLDPETGQIREDIEAIDPTVNWAEKAVEAFPLETTTNQGLHEYIKDSPKQANRTSSKVFDKKGGFYSENLVLTTPPFMQLAKDEKGFNVKGEDGTYLLEPKFEKLPDGSKILSKDVFDDVTDNKPSLKARLKGEAVSFIKQHNKENKIDKPIDEVEVERVARGLLYEDMKTAWGNRGVQQVEVTKPPQIKNITNINTGGRGSGEVTINDVYGSVEKKVKEDIENLGGEGKTVYTRVNALGTDAASIIAKTANDLKPDAKLGVDNLFLHEGKDGKIDIYQTSTDDNGNEKVVVEQKYKIGTLPRVGTNLKVQPNTKAKVEVVKQGNTAGQPNKGKVYKIGGKDFTEEQLQKGADKNKMSLADYKKSIGL